MEEAEIVRRSPALGVLLVLALAVALGFTACGGGDETTSVEADAPEADTQAIESLLVAYGLTDDAAEGCQLFTTRYLAGEGKDCLSEKWVPVGFTVEDVSLDGDYAYATVTREDGQQMTAELDREGEPGDAYGGWKLADDLTEVPTKDDSAVPETETPTPDAVSTPQAPEEKATAYRACIEAGGAKGVKQSQGALPSVDFSGGGSRVNAVFGSSEEDAEQGLASIKQRKPFFAQRFGTVVLYTVDDPLAADLDLGLSCVKQVG